MLKAKKQSKAGSAELKNEASELAEKARLEVQKKSQALNEQRKDQTEQKAVLAQVRQMIEMNAIEKLDPKLMKMRRRSIILRMKIK